MRQQPAGLQSVILDSVSPPSVKMYELSSKPAIEAALALFASCAVDKACNVAYPRLLVRFNRLMAKLQEHPIQLSTDQSITAEEVVSLFTLRNSRYNGVGI